MLVKVLLGITSEGSMAVSVTRKGQVTTLDGNLHWLAKPPAGDRIVRVRGGIVGVVNGRYRREQSLNGAVEWSRTTDLLIMNQLLNSVVPPPIRSLSNPQLRGTCDQDSAPKNPP